MMRLIRFLLIYCVMLTALLGGVVQGRAAAMHFTQLCSQKIVPLPISEKQAECPCAVLCALAQDAGDVPNAASFLPRLGVDFVAKHVIFSAFNLAKHPALFPLEPRAPTFFLV